MATVRPHVIVIGCTSVSGLDDGALEAKLAPEIEAVMGAPVVTVLPGVVAGLPATGCRRVVMVAPHGADIDEVIVRALEAAGLPVSEVHSMGFGDNFGLGRVPPRKIVRFVSERVASPLGDRALFLTRTFSERRGATRAASPVRVAGAEQRRRPDRSHPRAPPAEKGSPWRVSWRSRWRSTGTV